MPSHLSSIGFPVAQREEFASLVVRAVQQGEPFETALGTYVRWSPGGGAELWAQLSRQGEVVGLNPHFASEWKMSARIESAVGRSNESPLDGGFYAWSGRGEDDPDSTTFPFVFDTPDFAAHQMLALPTQAEVQIAAFAHTLSAYGSEEEYYAAQTEQHGSPTFAVESFIPSGLFKPGGEPTLPPEAEAIFSGRVLRANLLANPATGALFYALAVRTLGGIVNVVADPAVPEGNPVPGGIVTGSFWLSGLILRTPSTGA